MLNKLLYALRNYDMAPAGSVIICGVSGGADSMALLWGMWLLREKLNIQVEAAHFNHHLRGEESQRDEEFVRDFCRFHDIPLHVGGAQVEAGAKGLEAAARDARYAFFRSLNGIIATAHTADDNAETILMHLIRGTALRGLGGITPKAPGVIRPMLDVTRQEVETFLKDQWIDHVEDSTNASDQFLRNRVRHHLMPFLREENPNIARNLSGMAQRLRQEEEVLQAMTDRMDCRSVEALRCAPAGLRRRGLERLLKESGMAEPNASHIAQAEALIDTDKPSAFSVFAPGVMLRRSYDRLEKGQEITEIPRQELTEQSAITIDHVTIRLSGEKEPVLTTDRFTVCPQGKILVRSRLPGDRMRLSGGTKTLKKLFTDLKIPAAGRLRIPVIADDRGVLGVYGIGANLDRLQGNHPVTITFESSNPKGSESPYK